VYVCHCRVITDRTIRQAVMAGAQDVDAVMDACGAGEACGGCIPSIEALLADAQVAVRHPERIGALQALRRGSLRPLPASA
jgi:bacterioferritin-associated ferredoxin